MKEKKARTKMLIVSVLMWIVANILYATILFNPMDIFEFDKLTLLLFPAECLLFISIVLGIYCIFYLKKVKNAEKTNKVVISITSISAFICVCLVIFNCLTFLTGYTPEHLFADPNFSAQEYMPFHDIDEGKYYSDIMISHITGTDFLIVECSDSMFMFDFDEVTVNYGATYFKSVSPFMNAKFRIENSNLFKSIVDLHNHYPSATVKKYDGIRVRLYVNGDDYETKITDINGTFCSYLTNASMIGVDEDTFVAESVKQYRMLKQAVKEKIFLMDLRERIAPEERPTVYVE